MSLKSRRGYAKKVARYGERKRAHEAEKRRKHMETQRQVRADKSAAIDAAYWADVLAS